MSARSDWCNHAQHDACRYPKCGCGCHHNDKEE